MFITKKKIRKQLCKFLSEESIDSINEAYLWITNAPFWQWKDRLWCVCNKFYAGLDEVKRNFEFLNHKNFQ